MTTARNVLIVDDEPVVCLSAQHVLSDQGYTVETNTDPIEGLRLAMDRDYAAVLVDIKMDKLNGLDFLAALRKNKPDLPVLMITGFPSEENVSRSRELRASGLLEKPFTPEALTNSLRNLWAVEIPGERPASPAANAMGLPQAAEFADAAVCRPDPATRYFVGESYFHCQSDGVLKVGAIVAGPHAESESSLRLPQEGDFVYRGLPLAIVEHGPNHRVTVPSPVTGRVRTVNRDLEENPELLWTSASGGNWIARIEPTRLGRDLQAAGPRDAAIVSSNPVLVHELSSGLESFGCQMTSETSAPLVFLDADSLGAQGVALAAELSAMEPARKVVVLGHRTSLEADYRNAGVFFFATSPVDARELNDILAAAFRRNVPALRRVNEADMVPDLLRSIKVQNRAGERVTLLTEGNTLTRRSGIGRSLTELLLRNDFPVETMRAHHVAPLTAATLEAESAAADRIVIVRFENRGGIPGTIRMHKEERAATPILSVNVQSDPRAERDTAFDAATEQALAQTLLEILA